MFPGFRELTHNQNSVGLNSPRSERIKMKVIKFSNLLGLGLVLTVVVMGCKSTHYGKTPLGDDKATPGGAVGETIPPAPAVDPNEKPVGTENPIPISDPNVRKDWPRDREIFKADTVHFDYDSSVIKPADKPKVAAAAEY